MPSVCQRETNQEARKTLTIRLPVPVYAYVKAQAKRAGLSMNEWIKKAISGGSA